MKNIKASVPNILTFINLSLGILAILFAIEERSVNFLIDASLLIMFAALTDRFDGKVARALGVTSDLGKELDSLSDLISFGVAPMIITWKICLINLGAVGYLIAIIFPLAGAYRLARFNIASSSEFFAGLPITVSGALLTIFNIYTCFSIINNRFYNQIYSIISAILMLLLSFLMISKYRIKKM